MIRKAIIVMLTLAALLSVAAYFSTVPANVGWETHTNFDASPLPVHSAHTFNVTLQNHILSVGHSRFPPRSLSPDQEKRYRKIAKPGVIWRRGSRTKRHRILPLQFQWRPYIHTLGHGGGFTVSIPLWYTTLAFAAYPTIAFIRGPLRRHRRRKRGLCVTCGYDLTGSPERCPECGAKIEPT